MSEKIDRVAFDTDGQAWGLVEQYTKLDGHGLGRIDYSRWVRFDAIPFSDDGERVTAGTWEMSWPPEQVPPRG